MFVAIVAFIAALAFLPVDRMERFLQRSTGMVRPFFRENQRPGIQEEDRSERWGSEDTDRTEK